jgi:UDP-GlcNAc:undecaprenyl-phosphate GlcNAc-1-phosphate transferase
MSTPVTADYMSNLTLAEVAAGVIAAAVMVFFAQPIGQALGVIDHPGGKDNHKLHANPVPAVGGIILGVCALIVVAIDITFSQLPRGYSASGDLVISAAIAGSMVLGLADDRRHVPALTRLAISAALFTAMLLLVPNLVLRTVSISAMQFAFSPGPLAIPFTVLCLLALQNAVNMVDGRNGLLLGLYLIWMSHFLEHAPQVLQAIILALIAVGVVLFIANVSGRLFMGDCGSYGVACIAGIMSLNLYSSSGLATFPLSSGEIILAFIVPAADMIRLMVTRLRAGRSPLSADQLHLHHLLDARLGWRAGWVVYMALVGVPIVIEHIRPGDVLWVIGGAHACYIALVAWLLRSRRGEGAPGVAPAAAAAAE